ncbi:MAG: cobalamin biosynthesis protein [Methylococcales bacterium]|nr:cobalamin biosynthesis protein [Methylococcales bacterium]
MQVILGIGCDRGTPLQTLEDVIDQALSSININRSAVLQLATIDKKNDEQAILQLSEQQHWPLNFYSAQQLSQVEVPSPSAVVLKYMGTPSVSEAAAILAANTDMSNLLVEKFKFRGNDGKNATVSIVKV